MEKKFHQHPNASIGKVHLKVENLERSLDFYREMIGFTLLAKEGKKAELGVDGDKTLLVLEQPADISPKQPRRTGLYHFALLLPTRGDLGQVLRHLIEENYPLGASDHLVSEALYLDDPDGNGIEIYADRSSAGWKWNGGEVEMATKQLDARSLLAEAGEGKWANLPEGTILGHIHLHVSNLEEASEFYGRGLGFNLVSRYPQAYFMSYGGYHHHLGLNTWNGTGIPAPDAESAGMEKYSILFPSSEARKQAVSRLEQMGFEVNADFIVKDPSGNKIELAAN